MQVLKPLADAQSVKAHHYPTLVKNSENIGPGDWVDILDTLAVLNKGNFDGFLITHGTDTIAYSVAACLCFKHLWRNNIIFTGAFIAPGDKDSDAANNLKAAFNTLLTPLEPKGVFVSGTDGGNRLISGEQLVPSAFDETTFRASYGSDRTEEHWPVIPVNLTPRLPDVQRAISNIAMLVFYPGIDFDFLVNACKGKRYIIIETYHSGTGPAEGDFKRFLNHLEEHQKETLILSGPFPKKLMTRPYLSTSELALPVSKVYRELQPHFLYTFCLLSDASGLDRGDVTSALEGFELLKDAS